MKLFIKHILIITFLGYGLLGFSQDVQKGYRIDGDEVVFTFNANEYKYLTNDKYHDKMEPSEVMIKSVAVAGEFNDWSRDLWKMKMINKDTYEFRKKIEDFNDEFDWEFKFVINEYYWAEPSKKDPNSTRAKDKYGNDLHVYNLKLFSAYASENGNASFKLKGYNDAKNVILSGSFNRWDETLFKMKKGTDGWGITLQLRPDVYEYKFIVDGNWIEDPQNPSKKKNEYHGYNSLINIKVPITFTLSQFKDAKNVTIAGDFNDWSKDCCKMTKTDSGWQFTTFLSGGKHHYKFIVDGKWITDPDNPVREYDDKGNINSVYMVH